MRLGRGAILFFYDGDGGSCMKEMDGCLFFCIHGGERKGEGDVDTICA